ncbi:Malto-oligosyltrehalose synthase [Streptomyces misionensis JCM 4497]
MPHRPAVGRRARRGTRPAHRRGPRPRRRSRARGTRPCHPAGSPGRAAGREYSARRDQRPAGAVTGAEAEY